MRKEISIRPETETDVERIEEITVSAFKDHPHSNQSEHLLVSGLREQSALEVSLVAEDGGQVVGHIAFSQVTINGEHIAWYGLAPVSVDPNHQNQGIGSKLIITGLEAIRKLGVKGCVLLGEPEYYGRFGFKPVEALKLDGVPPEYFQALLIDGNWPSGNVEYHRVFLDNG